MTTIVPVLGALGLLFVLSGIPWSRDPKFVARVEPYIRGLDRSPRRGGREDDLTLRLTRLWNRLGPGDARELIRRLDAAGRPPDTDRFRVEQVTWGLTSAVAIGSGFLLAAAAGLPIDPRGTVTMIVIAFAIGCATRDWWLGHEGERRRERMAEDLPLALDLVALAVMAGESVPAAFERVGAAVQGAIGIEFDRVMADVRSGDGLVPALEGFSARMTDSTVSRFVDALCTGIERGTPLAEVLRAQADDSREAARRRLIELGGRKEVVMLVPVVFLIMPVVVVFALFPGLVSLRLLVP